MRPFPALMMHFGQAMFRGSEDTEFEIGIAGILGLLAVPGALLSLTLLDKYSSLLMWIRGQQAADALITSIPDKYFLIVFSMVVTGIVTVLRWDRILPGRFDFLNLAPLPITMRSVFAASLSAMLLVSAVFAVAVNAASSILFPAIVTASQQMFSSFFSFAAIHALCVVTASAFLFFCCLAIMGTLMAVLPHRLFRRISLYVRVAVIIALVALLATSFSVPQQLRTAPEGYVRYLPPVWFLALYQSLQNRASPALEEIAGMAMPGLGLVFLLGMISYTVSYRRYFLRLTEMTSRAPLRPAAEWPVPTWMLRSAFQQACYRFGMKTMVRSESHSIVLGAFGGLGLVASAQVLTSAHSLLSELQIPLIIAYLLICGMRLAFEFPAGIRANWIFKTTLDPASHESASVARKMILTLLVPAIIVPTAIISGLPHALYVLALSLLLIEGLLIGFRKIPFTCPLPQFGSHVTVGAAAGVVGFFLFTWLAATVELWALLNPVRFLVVAAGLGAIWEAIRRVKLELGSRSLNFDGTEPDGRLITS